MSLNIEYRSITVLPLPTRTLMVRLRFEWGSDPSLVRDLRATLVLPGNQGVVRVSHPIALPGYPRHVTRDQSRWEETLEFPLSSDSISAIQKHRRDDVPLGVEVRYYSSFLRDLPANGAVPLAALAGSASQKDDVYFAIPQSEWTKLLAKLEWDLIDIIEISRSVLVERAELVEAFERLKTAQVALWRGDYRQVAIDCRGALESAFKHFGGNDVKTGADALWGLVFVDDPDRQRLVNGLVLSLTSYLHHFRHEKAPPVYATKSEAELFLSTTSLVFSLVSRRLAKLES